MSINAPVWGDDILDSRDIIDHLAELVDEIDSDYETYVEDFTPRMDRNDNGTWWCNDCVHVIILMDDDEHTAEDCSVLNRTAWEDDPTLCDPELVAERDMWQEINDEGEGYAPDWQYGEQLIHERYFTTYAQELADDIGAVASDSWPNYCIDWERAANDLKVDYTTIDHDGETYYVR